MLKENGALNNDCLYFNYSLTFLQEDWLHYYAVGINNILFFEQNSNEDMSLLIYYTAMFNWIKKQKERKWMLDG